MPSNTDPAGEGDTQASLPVGENAPAEEAVEGEPSEDTGEDEGGSAAEEGGVVAQPPDEEPPFHFDPAKHRAETARWLAYVLVGILGASLLLHYIVVLCLYHTDENARLDALKAAFNAWLPVIAGLASAAATYYFTQERREG